MADEQPKPESPVPASTFTSIEGQVNTSISEEEAERIRAAQDAQHSMMAFILLFALFSFQFVILIWKQRHYRSFQAVTLLGLWLIPIYLLGYHAHFWRFVMIWSAFTLVNAYVLYRASRTPLDHKTPRLVYRWFAAVYKVSYAVGVAGYIIIMLHFFDVIQIFYKGEALAGLGVLLLCYGLYFGVLSRDIVEICTDRMASTLGYYNKDGFPRKHLRAHICAICGSAAVSNSTKEAAESEPVHMLACRHVFHEECVRGWCLIGKKDICPYCKEKVDLKEFKTNPWDTQQQLYLSLLDGVRYLVVWQPIIFVVVKLAYHLLGLQ